VLINPITPTQSADFCTDSELCLTLPVPLPTQTSLPRTDSLLSTSSLEQLSTASVTSSPLLNHEEGKTVRSTSYRLEQLPTRVFTSSSPTSQEAKMVGSLRMAGLRTANPMNSHVPLLRILCIYMNEEDLGQLSITL